ncbi:MAG: 16S rRNA (guanine(966)-N(2))-methyltransferase RsmD [Methylophaga sp.]|nr:16S rRNA (guanine(966)-N(2))-methyltransferase RsmD [Methylophaga sp.]
MAKQNKTKPNTLRIIGGQWRGRRLGFPDVTGLRPTPDRVRETVFNWLQTVIPGAYCLDCCAGSGALGFEAASRGALHVDMVEPDRLAFQQLQTNASQLQAATCELHQMTAQQFIAKCTKPYDVVFLDPPYQAALWTPLAQLLSEHNLLKPQARIYLECGSKQDMPELPADWQLFKDKVAGDVRYCLFNRITGKQSDN